MAGRPLLTATAAGGAVLALAAPWLGSGFLDGDAAAYAAQGQAGVLADRWVHLGYVALAAGLAPVGPVPLLLDAASLVASVVAVGAAAVLGGRGGRPWVAALGAAAVLLPWAPFAETDPLWIAGVLVAAAGPLPALALAVAISPAALLAAPWLAELRGRRALGWAALAVAGLTAVSLGGWWVGERGVLRTEGLDPLRTAAGWALHLPLLAVALRPADLRALVGLAPLLLLPADVPGWVLLGVAVAVRAARAPSSRWIVAALGLQVAVGAAELGARVARVRAEDRVVAAVAAALRPEDGLVAPFTWGARVSVRATGDPYGLRWHPPGRFLRAQRAAWCTDPPRRVFRLPPGPGGVEVGPADPRDCAAPGG